MPSAANPPKNHPEKGKESARPSRPLLAPALTTAGFGALSALLYVLLFWFSQDLQELMAETRQGHKRYFLVPIGIAFVFSLVHGVFTARFWEALGLRARK